VDKLAWKGSQSVPNYMNPKYQALLKSTHTAMIKKLMALNAIGSVVFAFQPCIGSTGDDTPIHEDDWDHINETLLEQIKGLWWESFFRNFTMWLHNQLPEKDVSSGEVVLLLNAQGDSFSLDWSKKNLPGSYAKFGQAGHEYQSNYERYRAAAHAPYIYDLQNNLPVRSRAELSGETIWTSSYSGCPDKKAYLQPWNFYAMTQWVATNHLDFWNIQPDAGAGVLDGKLYQPLWKFLNRYSGVRWPWQSRGAWIGFRDGLDCMDTDRFSEKKFGKMPVKQSSDGYPKIVGCDVPTARAIAICKAHTAQNCTIESIKGLCGGAMKQRRMCGINDVSFGNWRSDYGNFITRTSTVDSVGWWRVGPVDQLFGRFARGFANPANTSATIGLRLDTGLFGGLPLKSSDATALTVRIVFFDDKKNGTFSVYYDSQSGSKKLFRAKKQGSGRWREACVTIQDARFRQTGPLGSHVWIINEDTTDDLFDSVEIAQGSPQELAMQGCDYSM